MKYPRIVEAVFNSPWAIQPEKLHAMVEFLEAKSLSLEALQDYQAQDEQRSQPASRGNTAVIPVVGVIAQRMNLMAEISGGASTQTLSRRIREAANDPGVKTIVLDIDSPGGSVFGIQELGQVILDAREQKPVVAVANSLAASAAYWIGAMATEFVVAPGGQVGSIGVITVHVDWSGFNEQAGLDYTYLTAGKYKAEGNPNEPLAEETRDYIQGILDSYYSDFINGVAKGRGVSAETVRKDFGQGRVLRDRDAVKAGMADRVETLDQVLARVTRRAPPRRRMQAETDILELSH